MLEGGTSISTSEPDLGPSDLLGMVDRLTQVVREPLASITSSVQLLRVSADPSAGLELYHHSILAAVERIEAAFGGLDSGIRARTACAPSTGEGERSGARSLPHSDLVEVIRDLAHEVRNPLAVIKSSVQLLQRLSHAAGEIVALRLSILTEVGRIDATVADLERFAGVSAGHAAAVVVADAVGRVASLRGAAGVQAGVTLQARGDPALQVRIDQRNLELALGELLANAFGFSPAHTVVTVSWSAGDGRVARIDVEDQGPGVAAEHADCILRPFFSTSAHGTGLGLSLVDRVCRFAGGSLQWSSPPGGGCRFTVTLPTA